MLSLGSGQKIGWCVLKFASLGDFRRVGEDGGNTSRRVITENNEVAAVPSLGNPETFRGCAGTNAGVEPESGEWFKLYPNDVKANGCMSEEEIKKKLEGRPAEFHGDPQQIKICFCKSMPN